MKIFKIDVEKDKKIMEKIDEYERSDDIFSDVAIGACNVYPMARYGMIFAIEENEEIVSIVEVFPSFNKKEAYIYGISVNKKYRKKGIAKKILEYTLKELKKEKIHTVELLVDVNNDVAKRIYESFNFKKEKELINPLQDGHNKYLYKLNLHSHYYTFTDDNELKNLKEIKYKDLLITTADNVFSKDKIDFGSNLLIETFLKEKENGKRLLDYGCGYGVVGLEIKKNTNFEVFSYDINQKALELTKLNAKNNNLKINVLNELDSTKYDYILLNPPIRTGKENVFSMYKKAYDMLLDGGKLYIVIQTKQGAKSSQTYLETIFKNVVTLCISSGYRIIRGEK